jgi:hypothetical protein
MRHNSNIIHPNSFVIGAQNHYFEGYWRRNKDNKYAYDQLAKEEIMHKSPDLIEGWPWRRQIILSSENFFPWPIENPDPIPQLKPFIANLITLEEEIINNQTDKDRAHYIGFKGFSWCRLCNIYNNGSIEYCHIYQNGLHLNWPQGLRHYYEAHNVIPSKEFYDFVNMGRQVMACI